MSRELDTPDFEPIIAIAEKAARALSTDMLAHAYRSGFTELLPAHNSVFATLPAEGARAADMAMRTGITRQSMGEVIRDMVRLGILEMAPDPTDGRAKIVRYTDYGRQVAQAGFDHIRDLEKEFAEEYGEEDWATTRRVMRSVRDRLWPDYPHMPMPSPGDPPARG